MNNKTEICQEIHEFVSRVLKGECTPQETAILPAVLQMLFESTWQ